MGKENYSGGKSWFEDIKVNGVVIGRIGFSYYDDIKALGLGSFEIKPEYRGKGFGTTVIKNIIEKYKNTCNLIYCFVDSTNYGAIRLYKRLGKVFDKDGPNDNGQYYVEFYNKNKRQGDFNSVKIITKRSTEGLDDFLQSLVSGRRLRALKKDEKAPRGFEFLSDDGTSGEVKYNGVKYAYAINKNGKVVTMPSSQAGNNWSETIWKKANEECSGGELDGVVVGGGGPVNTVNYEKDFEDAAKRLQELVKIGQTPNSKEKPEQLDPKKEKTAKESIEHLKVGTSRLDPDWNTVISDLGFDGTVSYHDGEITGDSVTLSQLARELESSGYEFTTVYETISKCDNKVQPKVPVKESQTDSSNCTNFFDGEVYIDEDHTGIKNFPGQWYQHSLQIKNCSDYYQVYLDNRPYEDFKIDDLDNWLKRKKESGWRLCENGEGEGASRIFKILGGCFKNTAKESRADRWFFGQEAAEKYGDLIISKLAGKTVSKRKDKGEQPGGLVYEANELGIDMWDLLEALEGLCHLGRAMEIDDSTYKILDATGRATEQAEHSNGNYQNKFIKGLATDIQLVLNRFYNHGDDVDLNAVWYDLDQIIRKIKNHTSGATEGIEQDNNSGTHVFKRLVPSVGAVKETPESLKSIFELFLRNPAMYGSFLVYWQEGDGLYNTKSPSEVLDSIKSCLNTKGASNECVSVGLGQGQSLIPSPVMKKKGPKIITKVLNKED